MCVIGIGTSTPAPTPVPTVKLFPLVCVQSHNLKDTILKLTPSVFPIGILASLQSQIYIEDSHSAFLVKTTAFQESPAFSIVVDTWFLKSPGRMRQQYLHPALVSFETGSLCDVPLGQKL